MTFIRGFFARLSGMFTRGRGDADLLAEFESHIDMETDENVRRGMSRDEARRQAILASGGIARATEAVRDQRGLPSLESLIADISYAFRTLRRAPAFSLVVIVTLALGIGANTAIFSVVRGVILKPLPHRDGQRLVFLRQSADGSAQGTGMNFSVTEVRDLRAGAPALSGGVAEFSSSQFVLRGETEAVRLNAGLVTGNYFDVMGLSPVLGRLTRASDDGPGVPPVMVLTHEYWQRRFGGDSSIVGKQLRVNESSVTVIGVLQPAPSFPERNDVLMNMVISPHHMSASMQDVRNHRMTRVVARLAPSASLAEARAEVGRVYDTMKRDHPQVYNSAQNYRIAVIPFREAMGERAEVTLWILMCTAAFVMIIAAANVANLTLMRGVRREHELVVGGAGGAGGGGRPRRRC
jgi:putative ABC transport system permease protein